MKKYKIINKTRFYLFAVIVISISFSIFSFFRSFSRAENTSSVKYEEVYVKKGDTVWDIALTYKPYKYDVRDMVAEIRSFNEMDDLIIRPGEVIKVPLRKK